MNFLNKSELGRAIVWPFRSFLLLFFAVIAFQASAQCDIQTTITPSGQVSFAVVNPEPGSSYSWVAVGVSAGTGSTAVIPYPNTTFTLQFYVNGSLCFQKTVAAIGFCETAGFTTSFNNQNCSMDFKFNGPSNPPVYRYWNFGDGTPIILDNTSPATHAYAYPGGTFTVTQWAIQSFATSINIDRCARTIDVTCTPPDPVVTESEFCCEVSLNVEGGFPDCQHEWEIRGSDGIGPACATFSTQNFVFPLTNINTYNNSSIKILHRVLCGGTLLFQQEYNYTILNKGIYIGDPNIVNDEVEITLASCLNNNEPIFPPNTSLTPYTGNIRVHGILKVNQNAYFQDADICVSQCEGINVQNNKMFSIKGCNTHEPVGCRMWRGIDVPTGGRFEINRSDNSPSTISGAQHAIRVLGAPVIMNIFRTNFVNNYVGLYLNGITGNQYIAPAAGFDNCSFTTNGQLPPMCGSLDPNLSALSNNTFSQAKGFAGIVVRNSSLISILPNATATFSNLANGIWYENSSTNNIPGIKNCSFSNIEFLSEYGESSGNAVILNHHVAGPGKIIATGANNFSNCVYGFRALSSLGTTVMQVKNSTMTDVDYGVDFTNTAALGFSASICEANTISSNIIGIKAGGSGITVKDNDVTAAAGSTGILVKNGNGDEISLNRVNDGETGILVHASTDCLISENTMTGSSVGMRFIDNCSTQDKITCNTFDNDAIGLLVEDGAATGSQKNTGNVWVSPGYQEGSLVGAQNDNADVNGSVFYTDQNSTEYPYTIVVVPSNLPSDWFKSGDFVGCADGFSGGSDGRNQRQQKALDQSWEIAAYPNPTSDAFMLSIGRLAEAETAQMSMYDLSGKLIKRLELTQSETNIELGAQAAGIYLVAVQRSNAAAIQYLKIEVQH